MNDQKVTLRTIKSMQPVLTRGIKVVKKDTQGKVVESTEGIPDSQHYVNLKIEFDVNSCSIRPESFPLLIELGKALASASLRGKFFNINGHTDSDGSEGYNLILSFSRAQSVKQFIALNFSVQNDHLLVMGYGENIPIATNTTVVGKQLNRRVEIVLQQQSE